MIFARFFRTASVQSRSLDQPLVPGVLTFNLLYYGKNHISIQSKPAPGLQKISLLCIQDTRQIIFGKKCVRTIKKKNLRELCHTQLV